MTDKLIYEDPANRLPEWAAWMAKHEVASLASAFETRPIKTMSAQGFGVWGSPGKLECRFLHYYTIPGPWQDSLRRIVRLTDPAYYCAENPHTDDAGFLPHDLEGIPEWVRRKEVIVRFADGTTTENVRPPHSDAESFLWGKTGEHDDIAAYRIVSKEPAETDTSGGSVDAAGTYPREAVKKAYDHGHRDALKNAQLARSVDADFAENTWTFQMIGDYRVAPGRYYIVPADAMIAREGGMPARKPIGRPWSDYPLGTKAIAANGGHWTKTGERRWKWCTGATFPNPGGDAIAVTLPEQETGDA